MVQHLTQPFTRLNDRTRHGGFGLGLTLVASFTAIHSGSIETIALSSGGLDMSLRLPRRTNATSRG